MLENLSKLPLSKIVDAYIEATNERAVRLQNVLREAERAGNAPYSDVASYITADYDRADLIGKLPQAGVLSCLKLREIVKYMEERDVLSAPDSLGIDDATRQRELNAWPEAIKVFESINGEKYSDCFAPLFELVRNQKVSIEVATKFLDSPDAELCFEYFNGKTLQQLGEESNPPVTRERIRQKLAKYKRFTLDNADFSYLEKLLRGQIKNGQLPSNEEIAGLRPNFFSNFRAGADYLSRRAANPFSVEERALIAAQFGLDENLEYLGDSGWNEYKLIHELRKIAADLGRPGLMPMQKDMMRIGRVDLRGAVTQYGGQAKVAELAGLVYQGQAVGDDGRVFWDDERVKSFLFEVADRTGRPGMMPSQEDCRRFAPNPRTVINNLLRRQYVDKSKHRDWLQLALDVGLKFDRGYTRKTLNIDYIKEFVRALGDSIAHMSPSEVFVLFQQAGIKNQTKNEKLFENLVSAIQSGNLPASEVGEWANGSDSDLVDALLDPANKSVSDAFDSVGKGLQKPKPSKLMEGEQSVDQDDSYVESIDERLPAPSVIDSLKALGIATKVLSKFASDSEAVEFFIAKAKGKLWKRCFENEEGAVKEALSFNPENAYEKSARDSFLEEYKESKQLPIPRGYDFKAGGTSIIYPNLMQRLIAYRVLSKKRVLNLSGTGTGKTLSAILSSRVIGAHVTVIACPNNTISGWQREINETFLGSNVVVGRLRPADVVPGGHNYFILNHEYFQNRHEGELKRFIDLNVIDFVVIDEIHRAKQRDVQFESQRRRLLVGLITDFPEGRPKPRVLGLSATPVINNLFEAKSLIELVTSEDHSDIGLTANIENCMRVYQKFVTLGFRKTSDYKTDRLPTIHPLDVSESLTNLLSLGRRPHPQAVEAVLIRPKWNVIKPLIRNKTVIFVDYVSDIVDFLREKVSKAGFRVVVFTGSEKYSTDINYDDGIEQFIKDNSVDVLIASIKTVATGVDGLQKVCNNVIFANLPWTSTEYEQAIGRFDRQGSVFSTLDIHIPKTYAVLSTGDEWSWCESKLERIKNKKDVANAAVDGEIPDDAGQLAPEKATSYWMTWLQRLTQEGLSEVKRAELRVPLDDSDPLVNARRLGNYGDFAKLNATWNRAKSSRTHERLQDNREEWFYYHTEYAQKEQHWDVVPRDAVIDELPKVIPQNAVIADYGCGRAQLKEALKDQFVVHSLDHIAIDNDVTECDMADSPLADNSIDAAIFSLSLMGSNIKEYIQDAYRTLKIGGQIFIYHPAKGNDREKFVDGLSKSGFEIIRHGEIYKWHYIRAIKQAVIRDETATVSFK